MGRHGGFGRWRFCSSCLRSPPSTCLSTVGSCDLQFLWLPGLPNFSGKSKQDRQPPLILVPLAVQQFWKLLILWIESLLFLSDSRTFPTVPSVTEANIYHVPLTSKHSDKHFTCIVSPHKTAITIIVITIIIIIIIIPIFSCPSSQRK